MPQPRTSGSGGAGATAKRAAQIAKPLIAKYDSDGDGEISESEFNEIVELMHNLRAFSCLHLD